MMTSDNEPRSHDTDGRRRASHGSRWHAWLGPLCLALMGSAMLLVMWRSTNTGWWLFLPLALCVGMHLLMHRHHRD